ncbi:MAG TPA: efflux RND transporter periplasmic adaptor subunit [Longimicrobiales bacterium]|nr:efflux RND transporter periplasmic adaptor subunit [Longimicrobiales bacterium]
MELSDEEAGAIGLQTAGVEVRALASHLQAMGRILADPYRQAIVTYPFPARIARIEARLGDWVDPGDELIVLQSEEVGEATSAFYRAEADRELAEASFQRERELFEAGAGARKNFTTAEAELRVARANLDAAEKKLHILGFTEEAVRALDESHQVNPTITLFAPIGGKVVTNNAVLGGMVDEAMGILTILDPTRLWVEASIYEKDIARVRVGQPAQITVSAYPDEAFQGTITSISDVLDPETRAITIRTEVPNPGLKLKPGMFANLLIQLNRSGEALSLPSAAVLDEGGWPMVFVRTGPGRFEPRVVRLGARENGFLEVLEGLAQGDTVVTRGNFQLKSKLNEAVLHAAHVH